MSNLTERLNYVSECLRELGMADYAEGVAEASTRISQLEEALEALVRAVNTNELASAMACHSIVSFANVEDALKPALAALEAIGEGRGG